MHYRDVSCPNCGTIYGVGYSDVPHCVEIIHRICDTCMMPIEVKNPWNEEKKMNEDAEKLKGFLFRIIDEHKAASRKHPKFCDAVLDPDSHVSWAESESRIKARNAMAKEYADNVLMEEVAEAFNAYQKGDKEQALHEFAQCGAVILRIMEKIEKEMK